MSRKTGASLARALGKKQLVLTPNPYRRDDGDDESADKFEFNTDEEDEEARRRRLGSRGVGKKVPLLSAYD